MSHATEKFGGMPGLTKCWHPPVFWIYWSSN